jgi:hypothetical protein
MHKFLWIFLLIFYAKIAFSQACLKDIDLQKIPQQEIRTLLAVQQKQNILCINDIESSCMINTNMQHFYKQTRTYFLSDSIENVWQNYSSDNTSKIYNSQKFSFGLMLCKNNNDNKILYSNDSFDKLEKGQIIYLNLRLLKGLYKMAVAFEILNVDSSNKTIEFSYVKGGNKTNGKQKLQFIDYKNGKTKIVHTSFYKSHFVMRDRLLYPFFHAKVTNEFHSNLKKIISFKHKYKKSQLLATKL